MENGFLYGTTESGGANDFLPGGNGTIFKVNTTSGEEEFLYSFETSMLNPGSGLLRGNHGNLYGTTWFGGMDRECPGLGCGTVFELQKNGDVNEVFKFPKVTKGQIPGVLARDENGNSYGTTLKGGSQTCDCGTVFKLNANNREILLHTFTGGADGASPSADSLDGLVRDHEGNLYGSTQYGGTSGNGVVFKVKP